MMHDGMMGWGWLGMLLGILLLVVLIVMLILRVSRRPPP